MDCKFCFQLWCWSHLNLNRQICLMVPTAVHIWSVLLLCSIDIECTIQWIHIRGRARVILEKKQERHKEKGKIPYSAGTWKNTQQILISFNNTILSQYWVSYILNTFLPTAETWSIFAFCFFKQYTVLLSFSIRFWMNRLSYWFNVSLIKGLVPNRTCSPANLQWPLRTHVH